MARATEVAAVIAGKDAATIRAAKASLNGIDPIDVRRSYRYEQGFTYELNLRGIGDTAREAFLQGERGGEAPSA
jgi:enoyl-CoA hydratase